MATNSGGDGGGHATDSAVPARRSSTYFSVTFHGQSKVVVNTNANGQTRAKVLHHYNLVFFKKFFQWTKIFLQALQLITSILGPFRQTELELGSLATVLTHKG